MCTLGTHTFTVLGALIRFRMDEARRKADRRRMPGHGLTSWALSLPVFFYIISRDLIEMLAMPHYSTDEQTEAQRGAALPKVYTAMSDRQGPKSGALVQGTAFLPQPCGVLGAAHICCSLLLGMPLPSLPTNW